MKFYGKCELPLCGKKAFFVRKRIVEIPAVGPTTSQKEMCGSCFRKIRGMVK